MVSNILNGKKSAGAPTQRLVAIVSTSVRPPIVQGWNDPQEFLEGSEERPSLNAMVAQQRKMWLLRQRALARLKKASAPSRKGTTQNEVDDAFAKWIADLQRAGWTAYFVTFVFNQLPWELGPRIPQMTREISRLYSAFVNHAIHRTKGGKDLTRLPLMMAAPEGIWWAAYNRVSVHDIRPNDGVHFHAVLLLPPWSRAKVFRFAAYFAAHRASFIRAGDPLRNVDIRPMDDQTARVWGYIQKSKMRNPDAHDDVLLLPEVRHPVAWWELVQKSLAETAEKTARLKAARLARDAALSNRSLDDFFSEGNGAVVTRFVPNPRG